MTQVIEEAVKALAEFEADLDRIKSDASEAKKRLVKAAADEAEKAKIDALAKAQELANERVRVAKQEAETTAEEVAKKGEESLNRLKAATLKRKEEAVDLAVRRLLGG
ncbi:MAG: hypothetical protein E6K96_01415 [Thaumarchaeota archaeon]|nr:MAG: hypothetical protein E6K96_01415 [Nitrososphaerota archaeon]